MTFLDINIDTPPLSPSLILNIALGVLLAWLVIWVIRQFAKRR